jgi:hypothetical protein
VRIKIGESWYDSLEQPIMIVFDELEQDQIAHMGELKKYCSYPPEGFTEEEIEDFMEFEEEANV